MSLGNGLLNSTYYNSDYACDCSVTNSFTVEYKSMTVQKKTTNLKLTMPYSEKRIKVFNNSNLWVDTTPLHMNCISSPILEHLLPLIAVKKREERCDSDTDSEFSNDEKNE